MVRFFTKTQLGLIFSDFCILVLRKIKSGSSINKGKISLD